MLEGKKGGARVGGGGEQEICGPGRGGVTEFAHHKPLDTNEQVCLDRELRAKKRKDI